MGKTPLTLDKEGRMDCSSSNGSSSPTPNSPPFKVIRSPSPGSSKASDSPLLLHNQPTPMSPTRSVSGNGNGGATSVQPQPYLYPKATTVTEFKSGEPIFGEITHADAKFIGKIRYVPQKDVSSEREEEGEQQASATSEDVRIAELIKLKSGSPPPTPPRSYKRLQSEDNQYISMSRSRTLNPELLQQLSHVQEQDTFPGGSGVNNDPTGGYLTMRSYPVHLQQQEVAPTEGEGGLNPNVFSVGSSPEETPLYMTVRQWIHSAPAEEAHSLLNAPNTAKNLLEPLIPMISSSDTNNKLNIPAPLLPSQYSLAAATLGDNKNTGLVAKSSPEEALIPSSIRFIYPTSTTAASATTSSSVTGVSRPGVIGAECRQNQIVDRTSLASQYLPSRLREQSSSLKVTLVRSKQTAVVSRLVPLQSLQE